jgi:DNA-binding transcriptional LysR family regulator
MSYPTLLQLRHFHTLARHGNYARAAQELNVSQPALSRSIQALERQVGGRLVERERGRQGVALTPAGRDILSKADAILTDATALHVSDSVAHQPTHLGLGIGPQFATILLPDVLGLLMREFPDLTVNVSVGSTGAMLKQLVKGELEFFVSGTITGERPPRVRCARFASVEMRYAVRRGHPLLRTDRVSIDDIKRFPRLAGSVFRDRVLALDDDFAAKVRPTVCLDNFEVLAHLTRQTDGILATFSRGISPPLVALPFDLNVIVGPSETFLYSLQGFGFTPAATRLVDLLATTLD